MIAHAQEINVTLVAVTDEAKPVLVNLSRILTKESSGPVIFSKDDRRSVL